MAEPIALTVVIAVLDAGPQLGEQLAALAGQRFSRPWEVVVADNGSVDDSVALAQAFANRLSLSVVHAPERAGQAHARNVGAAHGSGDHLLFVDQDDVVAPGYLEAMATALDRWTLVAARIDTTALNPPPASGARLMAQEGGLADGFGFLPYGAGGTLGVRRPAFELVGGFDPAMPGAAEDVDLCWRVQMATGERMQFVPDAVLQYRFRSRLGDLILQAKGHGRAEVALRWRYRRSALPKRPASTIAQHWVGLAARAICGHRRSDLWRLAWAVGHLVGQVQARSQLALRRRAG